MRFELIKISFLAILIAFAWQAAGLDREEKSAVAAIESGDVASLKIYLEKHPDPNCVFSNGKTGLYYAIYYDNTKTSLFLLGAGADPDYTASELTMLQWAIRFDRPRIARLLIEYGAEVNKTDQELNTPLIYAAGLNNLEMCKILIDRGADPLHQNLEARRASAFAGNQKDSLAYKYLKWIEELSSGLDTVPSMNDGPYIYRETDERILMIYYERNRDRNLTRIIEKTIETGATDTIVNISGRDGKSYPVKKIYAPGPCNEETGGDIFTVGDVHGKYKALVNLLENNGIIDPELNWSFGDGHLVMLGDIFDRGDMVTETLWLLYDLQIQAKRAGGNVHLLLGNHEIMALTGDERYLNAKYDYFAKYTQLPYYRLFDRNSILGSWLRSQNIIVQINGNLFSHAGISPPFAIFDYPFSEMNSRVQQFLNSDYIITEGSPEDIILGPVGPQWYRGYRNLHNSQPLVPQQFIDNYLDSRGLKRMIIGHNEQPMITSAYGGRVISADVALDESGDSAQGLLISGDKLYRCHADGQREPLN